MALFWGMGSSLLFLLCSCIGMRSPERHLKEKRQELVSEFSAELDHVTSSLQGGTLEIGWSDAIDKMFLQNPSLIQADHRIMDARQRQRQIWRNLVPTVTASASNSFYLRDLSEAFTDYNFRIYSYISLGNLLDLPKRVYTDKLYFMGAKLQAENTMRQQVIVLYRMFQEQQLLDLEKYALDYEGKLIYAIHELEGEDLAALRQSHRDALEKWRDKQRAWVSRIGDFFMSQYGTVRLDASRMPIISYRSSDLDFSDTGRWGFLQLNLLALEGIAEDGRVLEAYLRYLPRANVSVSAPALYNTSSEVDFDPELIRIGPSLYWSMDTRGYLGRQIDRLKRNQIIDDWRKDKRRRDEINKLLEGKQALAELQEELEKLRSVIKGYQKAVKAGLVKDPEKAIKTMRRLREREVLLKAKETEICTEFWLIDEQRWTSLTKKWLESSAQRTKLRRENHDDKNDSLKFWRQK